MLHQVRQFSPLLQSIPRDTRRTIPYLSKRERRISLERVSRSEPKRNRQRKTHRGKRIVNADDTRRTRARASETARREKKNDEERPRPGVVRCSKARGTTLSQIPREIPAAFFVLHQALSRMHIRRGQRTLNSFPRKILHAGGTNFTADFVCNPTHPPPPFLLLIVPHHPTSSQLNSPHQNPQSSPILAVYHPSDTFEVIPKSLLVQSFIKKKMMMMIKSELKITLN